MKAITLSLVLVPALAFANGPVAKQAAPRHVDLGDIKPSQLNGMHIKVAKGGTVTGNILASGLIEVKGNSLVRRGGEVGPYAGAKPQPTGLFSRLRARFERHAPAAPEHPTGSRFSIEPLGVPVHGQLKYQTVHAKLALSGEPVHFTIEPVE